MRSLKNVLAPTLRRIKLLALVCGLSLMSMASAQAQVPGLRVESFTPTTLNGVPVVVANVCNDTGVAVTVGIASYVAEEPAGGGSIPSQDELDKQVFFASGQTTIPANTCVPLVVAVPPCAQVDVFQVDVFTGGVIEVFKGSNYYAGRLILGQLFTNECPHIEGRMTGGGSVFTSAGVRVTHGFQLRCDVDDPRQNLEINYPRSDSSKGSKNDQNNFKLESLTSVTCFQIGDTFYLAAIGTGTLNGVSGYSISFVLTDAGEPGTNDRAQIIITHMENGVQVTDLYVSNTLEKGNQQWHPEM